jgi:diphosphomevalonate decarboxylase
MASAVARARATVNVALVKYWGKRDFLLNLPRTSSLSVTLAGLGSLAEVEAADRDEFLVEGDPARARRVVLAARGYAASMVPLRITVTNTVPTAAGLASSASSMAALALAMRQFVAPFAPLAEVERWARLGSGSAVRSLRGGFVVWDAGVEPDGSDCTARTAYPADHLPLAVAIAVVDAGPKAIDSTAAMERSRRTSPLYGAFHDRNPHDLRAALAALETRDLAALGDVAERNALAMHEVMRTADPPVDFLGPETRAVLGAVKAARARGIPCFFTVDAGPNVKVFCPPDALSAVQAEVASVPGVAEVLLDRVGDGPEKW